MKKIQVYVVDILESMYVFDYIGKILANRYFNDQLEVGRMYIKLTEENILLAPVYLKTLDI